MNQIVSDKNGSDLFSINTKKTAAYFVKDKDIYDNGSKNIADKKNEKKEFESIMETISTNDSTAISHGKKDVSNEEKQLVDPVDNTKNENDDLVSNQTAEVPAQIIPGYQKENISNKEIPSTLSDKSNTISTIENSNSLPINHVESFGEIQKAPLSEVPIIVDTESITAPDYQINSFKILEDGKTGIPSDNISFIDENQPAPMGMPVLSQVSEIKNIEANDAAGNVTDKAGIELVRNMSNQKIQPDKQLGQTEESGMEQVEKLEINKSENLLNNSTRKDEGQSASEKKSGGESSLIDSQNSNADSIEIQSNRYVETVQNEKPGKINLIESAQAIEITKTTLEDFKTSPLAEKMVESIKYLKNNQQNDSLTIKLKPEQYGDLQIKITQHGIKIETHIKTNDQSMQYLLSENIQQLKDGLSRQGITCDQINIDFNMGTNENLDYQNNQNRNDQRQINNSELNKDKNENMKFNTKRQDYYRNKGGINLLA